MMSLSRIFATLAVVIALAARGGDAFAPSNNSQNTRMITSTVVSTTVAAAPSKSSTSLYGRKWNFNEGQSPWGLKKNGEIWNGRVAQMAFVWVFLQELIAGKGVFKGLEEGNLFFQANLGAFGVCLVALTAWLAIQGDDDYTKA